MGYFTIDQKKTRQNERCIATCVDHNLESTKALQRGANVLQKCVKNLAEQSSALSCQSGPFKRWTQKTFDSDFAKILQQQKSSRPAALDALNKTSELTTQAKQRLAATEALIKDLEDTNRRIEAKVDQLHKPRLTRDLRLSQSSIVQGAKDLTLELSYRQSAEQVLALRDQIRACGDQIENNKDTLMNQYGFPAP
ncbi:hypothetical protein [Limnobacter parvus]|uniref:Uncharacterized protein n=1 Tax=Limnobacter parvus TaxID=2939690 RepID=A0ABT1XEB9_9BURK|nr:hypothetical protein [Limnobacter parvus]MCR2745590.1 hypothetical protein [Limnobacter parvus]